MIRNRLSLLVLTLWLALGAMVFSSYASAQPSDSGGETRGKTRYSFSYTPIYQFETDLDSGGSFDVQRHFLRLDITQAVDRNWTVGLGLSFDLERWDFSGVSSFSGVDLWDEVFRPGISAPVFYKTGPWRFGMIPSADLAAANGAEAGKSVSYGAVLSAAYAFGPDLTLGLGSGIFERLGDTQAFPYVLIEWKINDRLRLANPFRAGPVGPAGLELIYASGRSFEMGIGGAYRSYRFRLDDSEAVSDGISEVDFWAPFLRMGWRLGKNYRLDISGGAVIGGSITIEDKENNELGETDYDAAPFVGFTLRGQF